ncbi:transposase [Nocardioides sp. LHG3406-4]|uniref:transposase n=1 Tax=Nocardioides sp. LHG3406-4 TaxID=2804575 RepID=UPI003CEF850F
MSYPSGLTDDQWVLLQPCSTQRANAAASTPMTCAGVVDAMLYVAQTGCQWLYLPASFRPWTRVWSQFRRWSRNGT